MNSHPFLRSRLRRHARLKFEIPVEDAGMLALESRAGSEPFLLVPCKGCGEHFLFDEDALLRAFPSSVREVAPGRRTAVLDRDTWVWCARCRDRVQAEVDARKRAAQ